MALPSLGLPPLDPTHYTALQSIDFGSSFSPDGRDHPIDAYTPVSVTFHPVTTAPASDPSGVTVDPMTGQEIPNATGGGSGFWASLIPKHWGSRLVFVLVGLIILAVVFVRLTK